MLYKARYRTAQCQFDLCLSASYMVLFVSVHTYDPGTVLASPLFFLGGGFNAAGLSEGLSENIALVYAEIWSF